MLAYMKDGRFEFSDVKDNKKMQKVFEGAGFCAWLPAFLYVDYRQKRKRVLFFTK